MNYLLCTHAHAQGWTCTLSTLLPSLPLSLHPSLPLPSQHLTTHFKSLTFITLPPTLLPCFRVSCSSFSVPPPNFLLLLLLFPLRPLFQPPHHLSTHSVRHHRRRQQLQQQHREAPIQASHPPSLPHCHFGLSPHTTTVPSLPPSLHS